MEEKKDLFIAFPAFSVHGDAMDDAVLDALAETLEISPSKIKVIERNNNFYFFTDQIPIDLYSANQAIAVSQKLNKDYEHSVHYLTKLVRRADAQINKERELTATIKALREENERKKEKLKLLEKEVEEKKLKAKEIEKELEKAVSNVQ